MVCGRFMNIGGPQGANVDHDHNTGLVRGILCGTCNTALGQMQDDPDLIRQLALYAETHAGLHASFAGAGPTSL